MRNISEIFIKMIVTKYTYHSYLEYGILHEPFHSGQDSESNNYHH